MLRIDEIPYTRGYPIISESDDPIVRFEFVDNDVNRLTLDHGLRITHGHFYDIAHDIDEMKQVKTYFQKVGNLIYEDDKIILEGKVLCSRPKRKAYI